ncbi:MAG: hypothetical protein ABSF08_10040 [Candidatus Cybelea sp.]|jgi:hypothetical protein
MSDQKKDEELDDVSGGKSHPIPIDPIRPMPPTHPGGGAELPITRPSNPVGPN